MKIQLALDRLSKQKCFQILEQTEQSVDWIEVGTGVIKQYGISIIKEIKEIYPNKTLVADMKTCDAGKHEAIQAFEAGADITTVMAFAANKTILDTLKVANDYQKRVMIDLLGVSDLSKMTELSKLGVDLVSLHFGKDMQEEAEIHTDLFSLTRDFPHLEVAVAGGITLQSLPSIIKKNPDTIIVGSAITGAENCNEVAGKMKELIAGYEKHN